MPLIGKRGKTTVDIYPRQSFMASITVRPVGTNAVVPLLIAYDRALMIDEIVCRVDTVGGASVHSFLRVPDGVDSSAGTSFGGITVVEDTNVAASINENSSTLADPRIIRKGETLFFAAGIGSGAASMAFYIRYRDTTT